MKPIYIAFVWHQHQPYYRTSQASGIAGDFALPWTRLHAVKDYLHMVQLLTQHPRIHQTINLVPSLLEQLADYTERGVLDRSLRLTLTPAEQLTDTDKAEMLETFFYINWERVISHYPRYHQLLALKQQANDDPTIFATPFWRDLQVWFNLAWIDPELVAADPELATLRDKGSNFAQADVQLVADKHWAIMASVVKVHRTLQDDGQIEVSTSPYFHPILPLLCNTGAARIASPGLPLPAMRFAQSEDAAVQIGMAADAYRAAFGRLPRGMWPSEGAVSPQVAELAAAHGLKWLASDEAVLASSIGWGIERDAWGHLTNPWLLYQPYTLSTADGEIAIIFRDHLLSDRIGFAYQGMETGAAVADMLDRLHTIRNRTQDGDHPALVSIILDGENCWEGYPNNGNDFLHALYSAIERDDTLQTCTVSEYLQTYPPSQRIDQLFTASWIGRNLETWIGEAEQNRAWEYLAATRAALATNTPLTLSTPTRGAGIGEKLSPPPSSGEGLGERVSFSPLQSSGEGLGERAWRELYIAEGSDWFWWYYSHNSSAEEALFDAMFRRHLSNVYTLLGLAVPAYLDQPIRGLTKHTQSREPSGHLNPRISGAPDASEWGNAGYIEPQASTGAMQQSYLPLKRLYYGSNPASLFLRLEANEDLRGSDLAFYLHILHAACYNSVSLDHAPASFSHELFIAATSEQATLSHAEGEGRWQRYSSIAVAHGPQVIELAIPLADLGLIPGDTFHLAATLTQQGVSKQALPTTGLLEIDIRAF